MKTKFAVQVYECRSIRYASSLDMQWRTLAHYASLGDALIHMDALQGSRAQIIEVSGATPDPYSPYATARYVVKQGVTA